MSIASQLNSPSDAGARLLQWWRRELAQLIPVGLRRLIYGRDRRLVFAFVDDGLHVIPPNAGNAEQFETMDDPSIQTSIQKSIRRYSTIWGRPPPVVARLPRDQCFVRSLALPARTRNNLHDVLRLDIERATPFSHDEIYHDHVASPAAGNAAQIAVEHLIIKRSRIEEAVGQLEDLGLSPIAVDVFDRDPAVGLPVDFLAAEAGKNNRSKLRIANKALVLAAVLVGGSVLAVTFDRQDRAIATLDNQIRVAKAEALAVRKSVDGIRASLMRADAIQKRKRETIGLTQILEQLTRVLPDSAWLADFRINGNKVQINGYARAAADLIQTLEQSSYFTDAAFGAPVTSDPQKGLERFNITFKAFLRICCFYNFIPFGY